MSMKIPILNSKKVNTIISYSIYITLFITIFYSLFLNNYNIVIAADAISIFILSFIPNIIEKKSKIIIPPFFKTYYILFIFGSFYFGGILDFYSKIFWWDVMLHFTSAIALGLVGFIIIHSLTLTNKIESRKFLNFFFALSFSVIIGVFWEFVEFAVDLIFNAGMQDSNADTMKDLILDTLGALIGAYSGILFLSGKIDTILSFVIKDYFEKNIKKKIHKTRIKLENKYYKK